MPFPNIDPIAIHLGPLSIRWYGLAYAVGMILGLWLCRRLATRYSEIGVQSQDIDDYFIWAVLGVIIGGRLGIVLLYNFDGYMADPIEILYIWKGGMAFHGGLTGVVIVTLVFGYLRRIPPLDIGDLISCVTPIGLFFGRIANFINGELWGRVTDVSWGVVFPNAGPLPRHPSQLYEAVLEGVVLFTLLNLLARSGWARARRGLLTGVFLLGYGICRVAVEFVREPDSSYLAGLTRGQAYSVPMIVVGLALIVWAIARGRVRPAPATRLSIAA